MPHLVEVQKKYRSKGVILLAISYEPESKVKDFVMRQKVSYIVGADAQSMLNDYGVKGFPSAFLIDPEGKIAWTGHPGVIEEPLEKLVSENPPKSKGFLAAGSAKSAFKHADKLYKSKKYEDAMHALEMVAKDFPDSKEGKQAKGKLKKMKKNSKIMGIIKRARAERESDGWLQAARVLAQYGDKEDAAKYYRRIIDKHPGLSDAKLARQELADLGVDVDEDEADEEGDEGEEGDEEADEEDAEEDEK